MARNAPLLHNLNSFGVSNNHLPRRPKMLVSEEIVLDTSSVASSIISTASETVSLAAELT